MSFQAEKKVSLRRSTIEIAGMAARMSNGDRGRLGYCLTCERRLKEAWHAECS